MTIGRMNLKKNILAKKILDGLSEEDKKKNEEIMVRYTQGKGRAKKND